MELIVPKPSYDDKGNPYPTLGPQVCKFLEDNFVYGPGVLKGQPYKVRNDIRYILYRAYEHYPEGHLIDYGEGQVEDKTGRRRFQYVNISLPKGSTKCLAPDTELILESGERVLASNLEAGDKVMSYDNGEVTFEHVAAVEEQPVAPMYEVLTEHGRKITVSEGHPFLLGSTESWCKVEDLKENLEVVAVGDDRDVVLDKVKSVTYVGDGVTIGVEVENTHVHVTNGLVTHNTEIMALVALLELHPDAPVRFNGYDPNAEGGLAPGRSVVSPFIPMLAPTKEQLKDLGYGAVTAIAQEVDPDGALFDVTLERVMLVGESESKIVPVAASDSRLDGQKPTFQAIDESHHLHEDRQLAAYRTLVNNLPKRREDDPWQMTCTTAGDPTEPSVALAQYKTGVRMAKGEVEEPNTFFYHRGTSDENAVFDTMAHRLRALKEASGEEVAKIRDLSAVARMWDSEENDKAYLERVWCNRWIESTSTVFDIQAFRDLGDPNLVIPAGATVTLGFDGAVTRDSTALVVTDVKTGVQNLLGLWERPEKAKEWSVPVSEVNAMVEFCMETYDVFRFYYDPPYWQEAGAMWDERWPGKVIEWPTRNLNRIYYAVRAYQEAIANGEIGHNGDQDFERHIANAGKNEVNSMDEEGRRKFRLAKIAEHRKFDAAMAAVLSWQARLDAIKKGARSSSGYISVPQKIR